jgi:hypothetical protein
MFGMAVAKASVGREWIESVRVGGCRGVDDDGGGEGAEGKPP